MKRVSNPVKPKVRARILAVVHRLYEQSERREEPSVDIVCRLSGESLAACDEVIREWRGHLPLAASEKDVVPSSEWVRKISDLAVRRRVVDEHLTEAVAAWQAEAAATDECLSEITASHAVQAKELLTERTKSAALESRTSKAEAAAIVAQREAGEAKSQVETRTKEAARALAYICRVERMADDLKAAWSAAGIAAEMLFAEIELERCERRVCPGQQLMATSGSSEQRIDRLLTVSANLAAPVTYQIDAIHGAQASTEPTQGIAMADETNMSSSEHGTTPGSCLEFVSQDTPKVREEVERLKLQWDGDWEIEHRRLWRPLRRAAGLQH